MDRRTTAALICILALPSSARADDAAIKLPAARTAISERADALKKLEADRAAKLEENRKRYVAKLEAAAKTAASTGDFDEGKRVTAAKDAAETDPLIPS